MKPLSSRWHTQAIGIVLPVHNEQAFLAGALDAIGTAAAQLPPEVRYACAIVLDCCSDASLTIARQWSKDSWARIVLCESCNVGAARRAGCAALIDMWSALDPRRLWLATTDADSVVPGDWLVAQLAAAERGIDVWVGRVEVDHWPPDRLGAAKRWIANYGREVAPIHGANLGFNARTYLDAGGFRALPTGEDRALCQEAHAQGAQVHHDPLVKVVTSARRHARAPLGFAHRLASFDDNHETVVPAS